MSWRDDLARVTHPDGRKLIGASFRGVCFFVDSADRSGGRRAVVHEFAERDDPYVEDRGRKSRVFPVEGYVLGADYLLYRDELIGALEGVAGPGELVHPYHGVRRAVCTSFSVRESPRDGGVAIFAIEFTEAPAQALAPTDDAAEADEVAIGASAALAATQAEFDATYDSSGMPAFSLESAERVIETLSDSLGSALRPIVEGTQELARLDVEIRSLTSRAAALVRAPAEVLGAFQSVLQGLIETVASSPHKVLRALVDTYGVDTGGLIDATTATRERERANHLALVAALRRLLAIEAARLAALVEYESHDEATSDRDEIASMLDEQAASAGDTAYPAIVQLRADLIRAVPGDAVLARLLTVERRTTVPSLLLAYQLYGSVQKEADVLARNSVRHPGFIAGTLRVLSA